MLSGTDWSSGPLVVRHTPSALTKFPSRVYFQSWALLAEHVCIAVLPSATARQFPPDCSVPLGVIVQVSAEVPAQSSTIWVWQEDNTSMPATKQSPTTRDPAHKNWRFYKPKHPITNRPCPHPKSGWKFAYDDDEDSPDKLSFVSLDRDDRIAWGPDETKVPRIKRMLHEVETNVGKSVFQDYSDGEKQTSAMFGRSGVFLAPKHTDRSEEH